MARLGQDPIINSPIAAQEALDRDMPQVLRGMSLKDAGWQRPDPLTLFVPAWGNPDSGSPDFYLLRLYFSHYPDWPPSAKFVNPLTREYDPQNDQKWLPRIEGNPRIQVHAIYNTGSGPIQLVCSSMILEFYIIRHSGKEAEIWTAQHNFAATLNEIRQGLLPIGGYKGRMA